MVDYRIFDRDKFTVRGTLTITDDGIASGFSGYPDSSSWIRVSAVDLNKPCKITSKVNSGDTINGAIFGGGGNNQLGVSLQFRNANTITCYLKASDGTTLIPESYTPTLQTIQSNTNYIATYEWTGTQHFYRIYTEGNIKVFERSIDSALSPHSGIVAIGGNATDQVYSPFKGSIDLKQFSITVDGVEVFSGSHLANTAEKLQYLRDSKEIIRQSIEAKGVEVPVETPFRQYADKIGEISGGGTKKERFIKVGNLINNNGVYSNFSTSNYISLKHISLNSVYYGVPQGPMLEFNIGFKTVANFNADYSIIANTRDGLYLNDIFTDGNAKVCYWSGSSLYSSTESLEPSTNYILKYVKDGSNITKVFVIKDNNYSLDTLPPISEWTQSLNLSRDTFEISGTNILIGANMVNQFYPSEINMNKCNYIEHGVEVWRAIS